MCDIFIQWPKQYEGFSVFTVVKMTMLLLFWVMTPCGLVSRYQRFGETYCLHLQGFSYESTRRHNPEEQYCQNSMKFKLSDYDIFQKFNE
jgi:hypothetical protein